MAYNNYNNYNSYRSNYNNRSNYQRNYQQNNYQKKQTKKSGCKAGTGKNGTPYVQGWKYQRGTGIISIICTPYKNTTSFKNSRGEDKQTWIASVKVLNNNVVVNSYVRPCVVNMQTKKVVISEMGMVLNPKAPNGGYAGSFIKKYYESITIIKNVV